VMIKHFALAFCLPFLECRLSIIGRLKTVPDIMLLKIRQSAESNEKTDHWESIIWLTKREG
jgi:hypothetical protein